MSCWRIRGVSWAEPIDYWRRCSRTWPRSRRGASIARAVAREPRPRRQRSAEKSGSPATRQRGEADDPTRQRSRYIPAGERREVYQRDGGRCSYVDARGERCCETRYLELHHLQPFAKQGPHVASNLALRCAAHNALVAEEDFGPELMTERRDATRHEALARQQPRAHQRPGRAMGNQEGGA
jgi:5-methylcytosine-specific restriction endonuclease McrA